MPSSQLKVWARLHDSLAKATREAYRDKRLWQGDETKLRGSVLDGDAIAELNNLVYEALGLAPHERALVRDMVRIRLELNDGKLGKTAVDPPTKSYMRA